VLSKERLRSALDPLFRGSTMPTDNAVGDWCRAYAEYAGDATAGVAVLAAPLESFGVPGPFLDALDQALRTMWMSAVWTGIGVTAATSLVPPVQPFISAVSPALLSSYDPDFGLTLIAEALHTYTLSITVSVVPASGTPVPTMLT
jgi:hypothetical protein